MNLLKEFKKVFAITAVAVMSLVALPIGGVVEAATIPSVSISPRNGNNTWVYVSNPSKVGENAVIDYTVTVSGTKEQIHELRMNKQPLKVTLNNFSGSTNLVLESATETKVVYILQLKDLKGVGINKWIDVEPKIGGKASSNMFEIKARDYVKPVVVLSNPTPNSVKQGETIVMTIAATDDVGIKQFNISESSIILKGFTADKKLTGTGNNRTLTLSNVQGQPGQKTIYVSGAILMDTYTNIADAVTSKAFTLVENTIVNPNKPDDTKTPDNGNANNNDNSNTNNANANNNTGTNAGNIIINNNVNVGMPANWRPSPNTGK